MKLEMRQKLARAPFEEKNPEGRPTHLAGEELSPARPPADPNPHPARRDSMEVTQGTSKYAAEQGVSEEEALRKGMEEKSKEFVENMNSVARAPACGSRRLASIIVSPTDCLLAKQRMPSVL
jgi:hypothetical protein